MPEHGGRILRLRPCVLELRDDRVASHMSGQFVLDRIHGWSRLDWRWVDSSIPDKAWARSEGRSGFRAVVRVLRKAGRIFCR